MRRLVAATIAILLTSSASAQCYHWVPTGHHDLTTPLMLVAASNPPRSFFVRLRGATLPRYDGECEREALFAQMAKAKLMLEAEKTSNLLFCRPEQDGDVVVATVLVDGQNLADVLIRQGLAQTGVPGGWCGNTEVKR